MSQKELMRRRRQEEYRAANKWYDGERVAMLVAARLDGFPQRCIDEFGKRKTIEQWKKRNHFSKWVDKWNEKKATLAGGQWTFPPRDWMRSDSLLDGWDITRPRLWETGHVHMQETWSKHLNEKFKDLTANLHKSLLNKVYLAANPPITVADHAADALIYQQGDFKHEG